MKSFATIVLIGLVGRSSVESFSSTPVLLSPLEKAPATSLGVAASSASPSQTEDDVAKNNEAATKFWGEPRGERDIIDFVSDALLFDDDDDRDESMEDRWVEVISAEPPLLIVHGFLERDYCDQIIDATLGPSSSSSSSDPASSSSSAADTAKHRLKRSTMGAEQDESDHRTSSTAWIHDERCPTPLRTFAARASSMSGLPPANMENLQVVRYQPGEEFQLHTDHLDSFNEFGCGGRLCTCLVYLNDSEGSAKKTQNASAGITALNDDGETTFTGGETNFPEFGAAVPPTKGSALFFWNTLERPGSDGYDENMFLNVDARLRHAGLPVLSGEKWVANRWIHPRNFGAGVRGLVE